MKALPTARPLAIDLFCGAGGAARGLQQAGFRVIGIDLEPQPRYPAPFLQTSAFSQQARDLAKIADLVWASPPCQAHSAMRTLHNAKRHDDFIPATRDMLKRACVPYVIENVEGAPLLGPVTLCGSMFGLGAQGCRLERHRLFETSFPVNPPVCTHDARPVIGIYGGHARRRAASAGGRGTRDAWDGGHRAAASAALGIDWMTLDELSQAIPPAYARFIGQEFLRLSARLAA